MLETFMHYMRNHGYVRVFTIVGLGFLLGIVLYLLRLLQVSLFVENIIFYTTVLIVLTIGILLGFFINVPSIKAFLLSFGSTTISLIIYFLLTETVLRWYENSHILFIGIVYLVAAGMEKKFVDKVDSA
ncbi:hypothetical protein GCM10010954_29610 [Halobacillus andaensis]|uniref:Uncharacterized protein n=1 Tax=Halobacillus andaensis TaxID=1176239 RepID=A0A917B7R0_HALAA|nr:hypothetical protein [Halobacillus andaensis]MBP2005065.1 asparagine N-glycosylation enzyme membrane subunit Stt3 [Halobacillus andaensis]GGF28613.1 hypothetical protein GCM10010954_29610 [Halobacillus andaensis]